MSTGSFPPLVFLLNLLSLLSLQNVFGFSSGIKCIERERHALLIIKQSLVDEYGYLSSWGDDFGDKKDCCTWRGVSCSNRTGHVVKLNLQGPSDDINLLFQPLTGNISSSMLELQHLNYLDLSYNDFGGQPIPEFIGSLHKLRHLDLSNSHFGGRIPIYQLGNLSRLQYLDLSYNDGMYLGKLEWFSHLSFLRNLRLNTVNLTEAVDWQQVISKLPSLTELQLSWCNLPSVTSSSSISFVNSSKSIALIDLSWNDLSHSIYLLLSNFSSSLVDIDLSFNMLHGYIPEYAFSNMTSLQHLYLYGNQIDGISPKAFRKTCSLKTLDLGSNNLTEQLSHLLYNLSDCTKQTLESLTLVNNMLCGPLPDFSEFILMKKLGLGYNKLNVITSTSIGQLLKLEYLDILSNSLEGTITETHMSNLPQLKILDLSSNLLTLKFNSKWIPSFQLQTIRLGTCKQGPHFPKWLQTQKNYSELDISNNNISDTIPTWFWDLSPNLYYLNLSYNHIKGILPDLSSKFVENPGIDLSSNDFEGPIPLVPSNVTSLNLSKNKFSGSVSFLCSILGKKFEYLDLSDNLLSGELPNCSWPIESLHILNLANNNFSGNFQNLMGSDCFLESLVLRNNNFVGELPHSLNMCSMLRIFDVGDNKFFGTIPIWIGDSLPNLIVLALRSNRFNGSIPLQLCQLSYLQLVDFSLNNMSGTIPKCLNNLTAMVQKLSSSSTIELSYANYYTSPSSGPAAKFDNTAILVWKGMDREYKENLGYLKSIDLSSNKLCGEIPIEITSLEGLRSLNLSRNSLTGSITPTIGNLNLLDSLDLSNNQLIGEIPPSFSSLSFLGMLDLSNNNLSGKIPFNTKLQSFDTGAYIGNPDLCGSPLPKKCLETEGPAIITHYNSDEDEIVTPEFYICAAIGFIVGFWGVLGSLILNRSWRHAYFQFLSHTKDRLDLAMVLTIAKLQRLSVTRS